MMRKSKPAASPDAYVTALSGWRRELVESLRKGVLSVAGVEESIKWGNVVFFSNGPLALIRAEPKRVLFGFWRGKRLREIEPKLEASGKYEMATVKLTEGMTFPPSRSRRLIRAAIGLNESLGDPTRIVSKKPRRAAR